MVGSTARGPMDHQPEEPGWWYAADGKWYPPESAPAPQPPVAAQPPAKTSAFLVTIGDIGVTADYVVTPNGNAPLAGSQWIATDMSRTDSKIPTWAIICAIAFAIFCLIGLLFLLAKERTTTGYVEVSVHSGDLYHKTQIPVTDPMQVQQIRQLVGQAQTLAARAR